MNRSTPGLPVHHQVLEFTQTHIHRVGDAIQPSHSLSSPSPPAPNPSHHQSLFQWVNSSEVGITLDKTVSFSGRQLMGKDIAMSLSSASGCMKNEPQYSLYHIHILMMLKWMFIKVTYIIKYCMSWLLWTMLQWTWGCKYQFFFSSFL